MAACGQARLSVCERPLPVLPVAPVLYRSRSNDDEGAQARTGAWVSEPARAFAAAGGRQARVACGPRVLPHEVHLPYDWAALAL